MDETVTFIPSHLVKALAAGFVSIVAGIYAIYEMRQIEQVEVDAFFGRREYAEAEVPEALCQESVPNLPVEGREHLLS